MDDRYLSLLRDKPILVNDSLVYAPNLSQIEEIGFSRFQRITSLLTMDEVDLAENKENFIAQNISFPEHLFDDPFSYLFMNCLGNPALFLEFSAVFTTYFRGEPKVSSSRGIIFYTGFDISEKKKEFTITKENYHLYQETISFINWLGQTEKEYEIKTSNSVMEKKFKENRLKKAIAKRKKARRDSDNVSGFEDMISSLCVLNIGYNLNNVWDLNIFQAKEQIKRSAKKQEYEVNLSGVMAGAIDPKKTKIKYWQTQLD